MSEKFESLLSFILHLLYCVLYLLFTLTNDSVSNIYLFQYDWLRYCNNMSCQMSSDDFKIISTDLGLYCFSLYFIAVCLKPRLHTFVYKYAPPISTVHTSFIFFAQLHFLARLAEVRYINNSFHVTFFFNYLCTLSFFFR